MVATGNSCWRGLNGYSASGNRATPRRHRGMRWVLPGRKVAHAHLPPELTSTHDAYESLDVTLLQKHVLAPIFGLGIRGPANALTCGRGARHGRTRNACR